MGKYIVDFFIKNCCFIEFYGTYWHADPYIYSANDILKRPGGNLVKVRDIWIKDHERTSFILKNTDYPVIVVWEKDFRINPYKVIVDFFELYNMIISNEKCRNERLYFCGRHL